MNTQNRSWTSILSLLLLAIITITTLLGFVPAAVALEYNKEILTSADFSGRDLRDSSFTKANLRYSNFSNSNLTGVSFFGYRSATYLCIFRTIHGTMVWYHPWVSG